MKRDIGAEILEGLEEIAKWKKGEIELKTTTLKLPTANDVTGIRERMGLSQRHIVPPQNQTCEETNTSQVVVNYTKNKNPPKSGGGRGISTVALPYPHQNLFNCSRLKRHSGV
jgi:hypothetical protein